MVSINSLRNSTSPEAAVQYDWIIAVVSYITGSVLAAWGINSMKVGLDNKSSATASKSRATSRSAGEEALLASTYGSTAVVRQQSSSSSASRCRCCCCVQLLLRLMPAKWYGGVALLLVGQMFIMPAFALADQSLLTPIGSCQFVVNVIYVFAVLKVNPGCGALFAVLCIVLGSIAVVLGSNHEDEDDDTTVDDLLLLYTNNKPFEYYLIGLAVLFVVATAVPALTIVLCAVRRTCRRSDANAFASSSAQRFAYDLDESRDGQPQGGVAAVAAVPAVGETLRSGATVERAHTPARVANSNWFGFWFVVSSACVGSHSMTFVKSVMTVAMAAMPPPLGTSNYAGLARWEPYVLGLAMCCCALWWTVRMNVALARFNQLFIVSTLQVIWLLFTTW